MLNKALKRKQTYRASDEDTESETSHPRVVANENHIWFYADVSSESCCAFSVLLNKVSFQLKRTNPNTAPTDMTITLHVQSDGGDVFAGFALYDMVRCSDIPVVAIVEGRVASAATLLILGCTRRLMTRHSFFLIHQLSSEFWGNNEEWKDEVKNMEKLSKNLLKIYIRHSKLTADKLENLLMHDLWWGVKRCIRHGLVDGVFGKV